jgi:glycosyltransferase involved in cell wall biosynthesis
LRLLFVHNDYGRFSGEERAVEQLARLASRHGGHEVLWWRRSSAEIEGKPVRHAAAFFSGIYNPEARREMSRLLRRERIDLVQVQNVFPLFSPSILAACGEQGVPVLMRCPNYRLYCPIGLHVTGGAICERCVGGHEWQAVRHRCAGGVVKSVGYALRSAYARQAGLFADNVSVYAVLSEFQRRLFVARGIPAERLAYLPNVARVEELGQPESRVDIGSGGYVAFSGRWSREKGVDDLLSAARRLPAVPFRIAGASLRDANLDGDPPPNVRFLGHLSGAELDRFYRDSRIVVVPSRWYEGFPNVIVEGMAAAKPVVGTRIGAIPEIIDDGINGLLAAPGDSVDLAARILQLWERPDEARRLGEAGLAKARHAYSERQVAQHLEVAYAQAMRLAAQPSGSGAAPVSDAR